MNRMLLAPFPTWALAACSSQISPAEAGEVSLVSDDEIEILTHEVDFGFVREMAVDSTSAWVLDSSPPFLARLSLNRSSFQFGREGEGPGELLKPISIQPVLGGADDGIRTWDVGTNRVTTFDTLGVFQASEGMTDNLGIRARADIGDVSYADLFWIRSIGGRIVFGQ